MGKATAALVGHVGLLILSGQLRANLGGTGLGLLANALLGAHDNRQNKRNDQHDEHTNRKHRPAVRLHRKDSRQATDANGVCGAVCHHAQKTSKGGANHGTHKREHVL